MKHEDYPLLNLSDRKHADWLKNEIERLHREQRGVHFVDIHRVRDQRTLKQNAYLHGVVFVAAAKGMTEAWGRDVTLYEAKDFLKDRHLRVTLLDANGNERGSRTLATSELDTEQCSWFIERCIETCAEELNTIVPPADEYGLIG